MERIFETKSTFGKIAVCLGLVGFVIVSLDALIVFVQSVSAWATLGLDPESIVQGSLAIVSSIFYVLLMYTWLSKIAHDDVNYAFPIKLTISYYVITIIAKVVSYFSNIIAYSSLPSWQYFISIAPYVLIIALWILILVKNDKVGKIIFAVGRLVILYLMAYGNFEPMLNMIEYVKEHPYKPTTVYNYELSLVGMLVGVVYITGLVVIIVNPKLCVKETESVNE